jgi:predicted DNA-binding transcriptional regulator AlpA
VRPIWQRRVLEFQGRLHTMRELEALTGLSYATLYTRIVMNGKTAEEAVKMGPARTISHPPKRRVYERRRIAP